MLISTLLAVQQKVQVIGQVVSSIPVDPINGSVEQVTLRKMPLGASEVDADILDIENNWVSSCSNGGDAVAWISTDRFSKPFSSKRGDPFGYTLCSKKVNPNVYEITEQTKVNTINKISDLTDLRIKLYKNLQVNLGTYQNQMNSSRNALQDQLTTVGIVEEQLNNTKGIIAKLKDEKNNKIRMVEIGTYEFERYNAHKQVMYIVILTCLAVLAFVILSKFEIVPSVIPTFGIALSLAVGLIVTFWKVWDLMLRSNRNYQEYKFNFDCRKISKS